VSLEFKLAIEGNLADAYKAEVDAGERACTAAMRTIVDRGKQRLRDQITGAGMGQRLANAWRGNVYPSRGQSLNAAGFIFTKAPLIIRAFNEGATIRSNKGQFLAIPTDAVPKSLTFVDPGSGNLVKRKRATPRGVEQALGLKLRFVYRPGRTSLLVADNARISSRTGKASMASKTAVKRGNVATVVMFILVPQVRLPKRLSIDRVEEQMTNELPDEIISEWNRLAA
jgi:hypothetical protein